jgi:hypothetical protein
MSTELAFIVIIPVSIWKKIFILNFIAQDTFHLISILLKKSSKKIDGKNYVSYNITRDLTHSKNGKNTKFDPIRAREHQI